MARGSGLTALRSVIATINPLEQPVVALSSTEAEYIALCAAVQEVVWLRNLLKDLNFEQKDSTTLFEDNQGAIVLSKNPSSHPRTKHIDIKYHYTREKVESGEIKLEYNIS